MARRHGAAPCMEFRALRRRARASARLAAPRRPRAGGKGAWAAGRAVRARRPGPQAFILGATRETPKRLQHSKRKTIGIRLPDDPITEAIARELAEPLFSSTLILPGEDAAMTDPEEIRDRLEREVDLIIDAGVVAYQPTTIIGFTGDRPEILRQGKGIVESLR